MGVVFDKEPKLKNSIMLCGWPGIGNIGINAINTLREMLQAEEFAHIEPWDFFNPKKVLIKDGLLKDLQFPKNTFYHQRIKNQDLLFFIGQQQPAEAGTRYAEGHKAYRMAELVLDVAEKFGCWRVYTSGAAVTQIHHALRPRVWAVPNSSNLVDEFSAYDNTVLMSGAEGRESQGMITGLNGLLLGVAKKRQLEAVCLMGEIPYYLQAAPWPYPKASKSVMEVLEKILNIEIDFAGIDKLSERIDQTINKFLETLYSAEVIPPQVREQIEALRHAREKRLGPITDEEQKKIMEHIDDLFKGEDFDDQKRV